MRRAIVDQSAGFLLTTHVTTKEVASTLLRGIHFLRTLYPLSPIIVIDDFSPEPAREILDGLLRTDQNLSVEMACIKGAAEGLPYIHFERDPRFERAVILHDSFHLLAPIDSLAEIRKVRFIKHIYCQWGNVPAPSTEENRLKGIQSHEDEIDTFIKQVYPLDHPFYKFCLRSRRQGQNWLVCFGVMSVITHDFLTYLEKKTSFLECCRSVKSRRDRMVLESIFALACTFAGGIGADESEPLSCFGEWMKPDIKTVKYSFGR